MVMAASSSSDLRRKPAMHSTDHPGCMPPRPRATVDELCRVDLACTSASTGSASCQRARADPGRSCGSHVDVFGAEGRTPVEPLPDAAEMVAVSGEASDHVKGLRDVAVTVDELKMSLPQR